MTDGEVAGEAGLLAIIDAILIGIGPIRITSRIQSMDPSARHPPLRVLLCDDCCCGTERKHPGVDHRGFHARLSAAAVSAGGRSRRVDCLGVCERSNVVVVKTPSAGAIWIGEVLDEQTVGALEAWIGAGAPLPVPGQVGSHVFDRRSNTDEADVEPAAVVEFVTLQSRSKR
jgi:hypothetical protein